MEKVTEEEILKESVEADELLLEATKILNEKEIILFNDPHNSFDTVIKALIVTCKHSLDQAEQCALIAHNKGSCSVKKGTFEKLVPICTAIKTFQLTAEIH